MRLLIAGALTLGLAGCGGGTETTQRALSPDELAALRAKQRVLTLERAAANFDTERPQRTAQLARVGSLIEAQKWAEAESQLSSVSASVHLLLESRIKDDPTVQVLRVSMDKHAAAINIHQERERAFEQATADTDLSVARSSWSKGGFGTIGLWTVRIKNNSDMAVYRDIMYRTEYNAPSGTTVTRNIGQILDVIRPGQTRTFELNDGFVNNQAERASFTIVSATKTRVRP